MLKATLAHGGLQHEGNFNILTTDMVKMSTTMPKVACVGHHNCTSVTFLCTGKNKHSHERPAIKLAVLHHHNNRCPATSLYTGGYSH